MVKEFEMRKSADLYSKISVSKTGVVDTNKLHSYKYNDDIFRRLSVVPQGKNHGFVMFLDWSGSMIQNLESTLKQLISIVLFCKRVQIPFEVYIFRSLSGYNSENNGTACFEYKEGDVQFFPFKIRNVLSSRMSLSELNRAFNILWSMLRIHSPVDPLNNTPLNSAIVCASELVNQFRAKSKVQIVNTVFLTDGSSDPIQGVYYSKASSVLGFGSRPEKPRKYVLLDEQTKETYYMDSNSYYSLNGEGLTANLLKSFKARTGCNLIGFFLYSSYYGKGSRVDNVYREFFGTRQNEKHFQSMSNSWKENKFIPVSSRGYDEYFIVDAAAMRNTRNELEVNSDMTKGKIARSFLTFSTKKSVNRVLLQRFIGVVSAAQKA